MQLSNQQCTEISKVLQFGNGAKSVEPVSPPEKPTVQLHKEKNGGMGSKTFHFVDPIVAQLKEINYEYAMLYHQRVEGGWMDYSTCVSITFEMVNIEFVEEFSDEAYAAITKTYPRWNKKVL
jgi:hypothetical protein